MRNLFLIAMALVVTLTSCTKDPIDAPTVIADNTFELEKIKALEIDIADLTAQLEEAAANLQNAIAEAVAQAVADFAEEAQLQAIADKRDEILESGEYLFAVDSDGSAILDADDNLIFIDIDGVATDIFTSHAAYWERLMEVTQSLIDQYQAIVDAFWSNN